MEDEVNFFKDLLRIRTVSAEGPAGSYHECVTFLETQCRKRLPGVQTKVVEIHTGKPILWVTLQGTCTDKKAILLNSHYDVVPAMEEFWDVDPWAAEETADGKIYGRGTQDMKSVCAQYILALQRILAKGVKLQRTFYLSFVPDEEIGGNEGMGAFLEHDLFQSVKGSIGLALDEGLATTRKDYAVFYGERLPLWINVVAKGPTGHGSRFIPDTAVEKLVATASKAFAFRKEQEAQLGYTDHGCKHCEAKKLGDVTTLNLTMLQAGVSADNGKTYSLNVIPTTATAGFDIRVPPCVPVEEIRKLLDSWTAEEGMSWNFASGIEDPGGHHVSSINPEDPSWRIFSEACGAAGIDVKPEIFPAATDSRYIRALGVPCFGFSPMRNSPVLLHEHNEYLSREVFLEGIGVYEKLLAFMANYK